MYSGPAKGALQHFAELGHACPPHFNPAEWLADLVAIDHSSPEAEGATRERLLQLATAWRTVSSAAAAASAAPPPLETAAIQVAGNGGSGGDRAASACGLGRQVSLLFRRSLQHVLRDQATMLSRASSQISSAVVFSAIFWRMKRSQSSIQDRLGLLQVSCVGCAMSSLIKVRKTAY